MVFPQCSSTSSFFTNPIMINPLGLGNTVPRAVWDQTAQVFQEINRITNQIQKNLIQPEANCSNRCTSSSVSDCRSKASASACASASGPSSSTVNGNTFEVRVDVEHFKPEEISVKLIDSNNLVIEGKHEERSEDSGFTARSFSRRFIVPDIYDVEKMESKLSLNGILIIKAPRKPIKDANGEKIIPITLTTDISIACEPINESSPSETILTPGTSSVESNKQQSTNNSDNNLEKPSALD